MNRRAWLLMALLAALWGASYLFIKIALDDGMTPVFIVFVRILLGAVVLVPIALYAGGLRPMRGLAGPVLFMAVVQVVGPFLLITYGERHIASSLTAILVSAAPIITALIAVRYDDEERPRGIAAAGVVMGIVGVVLLFGLDLSGDGEAIAGGLMVLLASAGYAIGSLYLKHNLQGSPPIGLAASTLVAGTLVLIVPALLVPPPHAPSLGTAAALLALGAGGTGLGFAIFFTLIVEVGPGRASLVAYIAPGFAVLYGVWLLGEPLAGSWIAAEGRVPGRARATGVAPLEAPPPLREPA